MLESVSDEKPMNLNFAAEVGYDHIKYFSDGAVTEQPIEKVHLFH